MSQSSKPSNNDDNDVWQKLFGDDNADNNAPKKGHTTLVSKSSKTKPTSKKRKTDTRDSSTTNKHGSQASSSASRSQSQSTTHTQSAAAYVEGPSNIERLSEFLCTPKHRARLPPPPLHCKFLKYPHSTHRFTKYCASSLELNYAWQLHHDALFPIPMDLMDPDYYNPLKRADPNDEDEPLNHAQDEQILKMLDDRENRKNAKDETFLPEQEAFLLQTQYLTGGQEYELTDAQRKEYEIDARRHRHSQQQQQRQANHRRSRSDADMDMDVDEYGAQYRHNPHSLANVKQTFIDVPTVDVHPVRKVKMAKVFDVYPHGDLLDIEYSHIQFDIAPAQQTKKCSFMPKYKEERMQRATQAVQESLLRCVNQKGVERERQKQSKQEMDEDEEDDDVKKAAGNEADWFSLYATDGRRKLVHDDEETQKFEWTAEFKPSAWTRPKQHILVIPKASTEYDEVYYAMFENRISLRHRPTDYHVESGAVPGGGHKGLSEQDKKFFKMQPMTVKLTVPVPNSEY